LAVTAVAWQEKTPGLLTPAYFRIDLLPFQLPFPTTILAPQLSMANIPCKSIFPMENNSISCCGYWYQGRSFPLPTDTWMGYWYNNTFIRAEEYDLAQYPNIPVVMWTNAGMQQPHFGTYPVFSLRGQYYYSLTEAQNAKETFDQLDYYSYTVSAPSMPTPPPNPYSPAAATYIAPAVDRFAPTAATYIAPAVDRFAPTAATYIAPAVDRVAPTAAPKKPAATRQCSLCKHPKINFLTLIGKICCSDCLFGRYMEGNMSIGEGAVVIEWTPKMVAEVHTYLMNVLSEEEKARMPKTIKTPPNMFVCVGKNDPVASNYPAQGHFSGMLNKCAEGGCSVTEHALCKPCANMLEHCPLCNSVVEYEELPSACPPDCDEHKPDFKIPCPKCKKVTPKTKPRGK